MRGFQVIKVGTSSLLNTDLTGLKLSSMARICETVRDLRKEGWFVCMLPTLQLVMLCWQPGEARLSHAGYKVVLVSSGAVGVGCCKMGLKSRPGKLAQKQAVSAVGQIHLMRYYQDFFEALGLVCAGH